jgi:site-specific recombinase XerD
VDAGRVIDAVSADMSRLLDNAQMEALLGSLRGQLQGASVVYRGEPPAEKPNEHYLSAFLAAKRIEGCSPKTLEYYRLICGQFFKKSPKPVRCVTVDELRAYLLAMSAEVGNVTLDNVRRVFSSFFGWLEVEGHILSSPVKRIHKIKAPVRVKSVLTDEETERLRAGFDNKRDLAIFELLLSTGMRIGELARLNRGDIDAANRECVVLGKGDKERKAYFNAKAKLTLAAYLDERGGDGLCALFVSRYKPHGRLRAQGVELMLREAGKKLGIPLHPHKLRRTAATVALSKGMPIEQVKEMLGHSQIGTTLLYAQVSQSAVKQSHQKYMG